MKFDATSSTDFYKTGHIFQFVKGTEEVYSNMTGRSNVHALSLSDEYMKFPYIINFGLQYAIKDLLIDKWNEHFFSKPVEEVLAKYERRMKHTIGTDHTNSDHFRALHKLGYLPIEIKSLPEGVKVPIGVPFFTIVNTIPEFFWLTNFLETSLSCYLWKPITSATSAHQYRLVFEHYAKLTGASFDFIDWQGHDFSFRGMTFLQEPVMSGAGHLLSFRGTDTISAIDLLEDYYNGNLELELLGGSVPATEHSVMCMGGKVDEIETIRNLITETYPTGVISIVSDTWDFWKVITEYLPKLKDIIMARDGKVVARPDSGDPVEIVVGKEYNTYDDLEYAKEMEDEKMHELASQACEGSHSMGLEEYSSICKVGDKFYKITAGFEYNRHDKQYYYIDNFTSDEERVTAEEYQPTPEFKGAVECLWEIFGGTTTAEGYKQLDLHIGLIYGDSISLDRQLRILAGLARKGFASDNIVLGIGSYTYQYVTRDTYGFAIKSTAGKVNGELREIFKDPKTDDGVKKSAKGLLRVEFEDGKYVLYDQQTPEQEKQGELETAFIDGKLIKDDSISEIRKRLNG